MLLVSITNTALSNVLMTRKICSHSLGGSSVVVYIASVCRVARQDRGRSEIGMCLLHLMSVTLLTTRENSSNAPAFEKWEPRFKVRAPLGVTLLGVEYGKESFGVPKGSSSRCKTC